MKLIKLIPYLFSIALSNIISIGVYAQTSQTIKGDCNDQIHGNNNNVTRHCTIFTFRRQAVVSNNGGATLVLKNIKDINNPYTDITKPENQLGLVESGAKVETLEQTNPVQAFHSFTKIKILEGRLKGKIGWVSSAVIKIEDVSK